MPAQGGARKLLRWVTDTNSPDSKAFSLIVDALDLLQATNQGKWRAVCATHSSAQGPTRLREIRTVTWSYTNTIYAVVRDRDQVKVLVGDGGLPGISEKLDLQQQKAVTFDGLQYSLGDISVCVANSAAQPGGRFLGVALEIEYRPLSDAHAAQPVLEDVTQSLQEALMDSPGKLEEVRLPQAAAGMDKGQSLQRLAVQYLELCNLLQARTGR